jgi:hypothetical protein
MRAEAISSKSEARNNIVRTWLILCRVEMNSGA